MIIGRTPYRISFLGGGTDYPEWYKKEGGAVISTTIDKYCYLNCRYLPPFFEHKTRVIYSKIELIQDNEKIEHPSVNAVLKFLNLKDGLEIHHVGDLPARSGIGSSSSFTVCLLNALSQLTGKILSKKELAETSIYIEQNLINEYVGSQDQTAVAFGGFNYIEFKKNNDIEVNAVSIEKKRLEEFEKSLMLFYLGTSRISSELSKCFIGSIPQFNPELKSLRKMVDLGLNILTGNQNLSQFSDLLHQGWLLKRKINPKATNTQIDNIYFRAQNAGALGGKLLGAGGGGFLLLFVPPERQLKVRLALSEYLMVPFAFENHGSQIIFNQNNQTTNREEENKYGIESTLSSVDVQQYH